MNTVNTDRNGISRRQAVWLGLAAAGSAVAPSAFAQGAWPNRPITFVVGYPPGGQTDFAGRVILASLQNHLGQAVVIDNKPGANGNIATDLVAKSPPDGYRLLVGNGGNMTLNPHTYRNSPVFDPQRLTPIGILLQTSLTLAVPASHPAKNVAQFISWVKAQEKTSEGVHYASSGPGSVTQAVMEVFRDQIGKPKMNHIPYKGSGPAVTDLIAGRVSAMFDGTSVVAPFLKSGQLRGLMTTGTTRVPAFPDVPTPAESGLPNFGATSFIGLYGPPGMDPEVVKKISAALNATFKEPGVLKAFSDRGDDPGGGSPEDLAKATRDYFKLWGEMAKANDIRAE